MKAYVTSIGESTTDLCVWALKRNGFEVELIKQWTPLSEKLLDIYNQADQDFVRVDADIIVNDSFTPKMLETLEVPQSVWWWQFMTYDWFQQKPGYGGVQFIREEAIPYLRSNIHKFMNAERPETELTRVEFFYNPRRFESVDRIVGLNNYKNDVDRVRAVKERRKQSGYDWDLVAELDKL